ncbi:MAG: RsmG family class I SAM-dependent methyltransferase [Rhodothermales bacterium]
MKDHTPAHWDPLAQLDAVRRQRLASYAQMLRDFNQHINLVSREDEDRIFSHHVLHCLYLTYRSWPSGSTVVDWGTGGGLPAIPLAIVRPEVRFIALDASAKKVRSVRAMARRIGLENLEAIHSRAERFEAEAAYSVSRATAPLKELWGWHRQLSVPPDPARTDGCWAPGLVCLKGGDLRAEIAEVGSEVDVERLRIDAWTDDPYFLDKVLLACTEPSG